MFTSVLELLLVTLLIVFLFGAKQIPKLAKTVKESIDIFKKEKNGEGDSVANAKEE